MQALQTPLDETEQALIQNNIQLYLTSATGSWLDYWGVWFGLHRLSPWDDDTYRTRLINHVLHKRNTVYAIRDAIADFIQTNAENIYIYEPYRNMFILNKSVYNGTDKFTDSYYRYAVIDVKIDANFPQNVSQIINLFRPAGVLWVLTQDIHGISPDAPIINLNAFNNISFEESITDYAGLFYYDTLRLTPNIDDSIVVNDPFIYNDEDSLFNNGKEYLGGTSSFQNYMWFGQLFQEFTPLDTDTFNDTRPYGEQLGNNDLMLLSYNDSRGKIFNFNPTGYNLISEYAVNLTANATSVTYNINNIVQGNSYVITVKGNATTDLSNTKLICTFNSTDSSKDYTVTLSSTIPNSPTLISGEAQIPAVFTSAGTVTISIEGTDNNINFSGNYLGIYLLNKNVPVGFSPVANYTPSINSLAGAFDVNHYLATHSTKYTTTSINNLYSIYPTMRLVITMKTYTNSSASLKAYNFSLGMWVNINNYTIDNSFETLTCDFADVLPYLNKQGLMFIELDFSNNTKCDVDYVGFTFSDYTFNSSSLLLNQDEHSGVEITLS